MPFISVCQARSVTLLSAFMGFCCLSLWRSVCLSKYHSECRSLRPRRWLACISVSAPCSLPVLAGYICLSIFCLSVCLSDSLSVQLTLCLSACMSVGLSQVGPSVPSLIEYPSHSSNCPAICRAAVCLSVSPSLRPVIRLSFGLSVCLSRCGHVCLPASLSLFV